MVENRTKQRARVEKTGSNSLAYHALGGNLSTATAFRRRRSILPLPKTGISST